MLATENSVLPMKLTYPQIILSHHHWKVKLLASSSNLLFRNWKLRPEISDPTVFLERVDLGMFSKDGLRKMGQHQRSPGQELRLQLKAWSWMVFRAIENGWLVEYMLWVSRLMSKRCFQWDAGNWDCNRDISLMQAEVDFLGQLHHPNLVKLIGYCSEADQRLLVYEFMTRGSLENHLFKSECSYYCETDLAKLLYCVVYSEKLPSECCLGSLFFKF